MKENKYIENSIKFLISSQSFHLEEIKEGEYPLWILTKKIDGVKLVIFFTNEENHYDEGGRLYTYLREKGQPFFLNRIILTNNDEYRVNSWSSINDIVINITSNKVIEAGNNNLGSIICNINENSYYKRQGKAYLIKPKRVIVTGILVAINLIVFLISAIMSKSIFDIDIYVLLNLGASFGPLIQEGEYFRLISSTFLHGGLIHLFFNMVTLFYIGSQIEVYFGKIRYLVIYFISGLGASMLSSTVSPGTVSVGASGAIFGLFGALLIFALRNKEKVGSGTIKNIITIIVLNLYIGLTTSNIDNWAHIGGVVTGLLTSIILTKREGVKYGGGKEN